MAARSSRLETVGFAARSKRVVAGLGALVVAVGIVGALHLPFARAVLLRLGGCPLVRNARPAQLEPARHAAMAKERGTVDAPSRPALGFELDRTTYGDVKAWAVRTGASCEDVREGLVRCTGVVPAALKVPATEGPLDELNLGFDVEGRLVNVSTLRTHLGKEAEATLGELKAGLYRELGAPHSQDGSFDSDHLGQTGAASLASMRYRYHDYFAELVALRFGHDGLSVREHYMSARDGS
jgi:hypothetical protein